MPQATNELRALMGRWFGDEIDDRGPTEFLLSHGFEETKAGLWRPPVPYHNVSREELACLRFLVEEWDHDYAMASYFPEELDVIKSVWGEKG
jgi:hypothetical protein